MARIYKSFQELFASNKSVFNHLGHQKNMGIFNAVWDARNAEVNHYKEENELLKSELKSFKEKFELEKKTSLSLEKRLGDSRFDVKVLDEKLEEFTRKVKKHEKYIKSLDVAITSQHRTITKNEKTIGSLETEKKEILNTLHFHKETVQILTLELEKKKRDVKFLTEEVKDLKDKKDSYKMINMKMTSELDRIYRKNSKNL